MSKATCFRNALFPGLVLMATAALVRAEVTPAELAAVSGTIGAMRDEDARLRAVPELTWNGDETFALLRGEGSTLMVLDAASRKVLPFSAPSEEYAKPSFAYGEGAGFIYFSGGNWRVFSPKESRFETLDKEAALKADARWSVHRGGSRGKSAATVIVVRNTTAGDVRLYWKDSDKSVVEYGVVAAGNSHSQNTFEGHSWEVRDSSGRVLDRFSVPVDGGIETVVASNGSMTRVPRGNRNKPKATAESPLRTEGDRLIVRKDGHDVSVAAKLDAGEKLAGVYPSSDGNFVAAVCLNRAKERRLTYTEAHPKGSDKPRVFEFDYAKPGDVIDANRVTLFDLAAGREVTVPSAIFADVWDFRPVGWSPDDSEFYVYLHYRSHQLSRFVAISRAGAVRTVIEEKAAAFIDYSQKGWYSVLEDSWQLLWASERDGRNHLYRFDLKTGALLNKITTGDYIVREVQSVDAKAGTIHFSALAVRPGEDPYYANLMRASIDGSTSPVVLTHGDGTHTWKLSPSGRWLTDRWSRVDLPPNAALRDARTGAEVCALVTRTTSDIPKGYVVPERFAAKGRDGKTDIYGVIYRPSFYKKGDRLPVIEYIYGGPHGYNVPKGWGAFELAMRVSELGYAVVVIDGMGTNWRDRAFHDVCWQNIKDAGYPDRIAWIKAAAAKYPELDISKVGIYGGSAGGQNACAALIWHHDFYKVAVADCGCHDNRIDKIWWNEAWMGWPIGPQYSESSNIDNAAKLKGDILLLLGEIDTNVDIVSTYKLADAFKKASVPYEFYVEPSAGHFVMLRPEPLRRLSNFFRNHIPTSVKR